MWVVESDGRVPCVSRLLLFHQVVAFVSQCPCRKKGGPYDHTPSPPLPGPCLVIRYLAAGPWKGPEAKIRVESERWPGAWCSAVYDVHPHTPLPAALQTPGPGCCGVSGKKRNAPADTKENQPMIKRIPSPPFPNSTIPFPSHPTASSTSSKTIIFTINKDGYLD